MSPEGPPEQTGQAGAPAPVRAPGLAGERTDLAWTRSAISMAASGVLIARAAFTANLDVLGVLFAIGMTTMATLIWRHAGSTDGAGGAEAKPQSGALGLLTAATLATAAVALVVTLAI